VRTFTITVTEVRDIGWTASGLEVSSTEWTPIEAAEAWMKKVSETAIDAYVRLHDTDKGAGNH